MTSRSRGLSESQAPDPETPGPIIEDKEIIYDVEDILGQGNYGCVYRGTCRGAAVAVKVPTHIDDEGLNEFKAEMEVMRAVVHPRVVSFLGAFIPKKIGPHSQIKLVMELYGQDLERLLFDRKAKLSLFRRFIWAKQAAEGLAWIHGAGIIHRDVKPSNFLVDEQWNCKICDFGFSLLLPKGEHRVIEARGTPLYVAPELVSGGVTTIAADVYSFGICCWTFIIREEPYECYDDIPEDIPQFLRLVVDGLRPFHPDLWPSEVPTSLRELIVDCCGRTASKRPTMEEVLGRLDYVQVDIAIADYMARKFWKQNYVRREGTLLEIPAPIFSDDLLTFFKARLGDSTPFTKAVLLELFGEPDPLDKTKVIVKLEHFGEVLYFLPLTSTKNWLSQITTLARHPWFWGATSSREATKKLQNGQDDVFMLRFSSQAPYYTLSFRVKGKIFHRRVVKEFGDDKVKLEHPAKVLHGTFSDLETMVEKLQEERGWRAAPGSPFSFLQQEDTEWEGYLRNMDDMDGLEEALSPKDIHKGTRVKYLRRSAVIMNVRDNEVKISFMDDRSSKWVDTETLLQNAKTIFE